ncbi:hypothetical protein FRD01_14705 [Microvenator marinus]|uniref:Uncharacterized protein n=1 Tax=Microvenator marinus TaxID=2600177 RepID=A0A5B8XT67_9DELT|nr:hypothetical protein [Microvenator marinus]QED28461.1 hypothetical protein FRD01_14705 [Microvenator marinus]
MLSDEAILQEALDTILVMINPSSGMGHPNDKKKVVWTFKILKKHNIPIDSNVVRQTMLAAGMMVDKANEIKEAAERVSNGGRFQGIGTTSPLRHDIFQRWKDRALERTKFGEVDSEEAAAERESKEFFFTAEGTSSRSLAVSKALELASQYGSLAMMIPTKSNLSNYGDIFGDTALKALGKNGKARVIVDSRSFIVHLVPATQYTSFNTPSDVMLIFDCPFDAVEKVLYNDMSVKSIVYVPWTADEFASAQKTPKSKQL